MQKVLVIVGPTASGKSAFGIECAKAFNGEIISGDSIQIYRGLNIGSAKISQDEMSNIKHHLIDIKDANETYSVKEFQERGRSLIEEISLKNKLPIIVGGTGLYIKALLYDYVFFDEEEKDNPYDELSNEDIYDVLLKEDPASLEKIHINNRKRLVRALNVLRKHKTGIADIASKQEHKLLYDAKIIGLTLDRESLYERINIRVDKMIEEGLLEEIQGLLDSDINFSNQSMQGIGYKEFKEFFNGEKTLDECIASVKSNTKHFAKRQYTWFKNQMNLNWYEDKDSAKKDIEEWLNI
ncbi:MAG: tRNA (adenosine(37)-N6)-dimethylallyltransferase MiaA [Erysipelotrichaceae bacterium]|nr:tRNA (adenosine(37)-N6)-dimethylallyltransferase MiaA [Erysipelotrichaceae bacterium]